jgi:hypothetical protein
MLLDLHINLFDSLNRVAQVTFQCGQFRLARVHACGSLGHRRHQSLGPRAARGQLIARDRQPGARALLGGRKLTEARVRSSYTFNYFREPAPSVGCLGLRQSRLLIGLCNRSTTLDHLVFALIYARAGGG